MPALTLPAIPANTLPLVRDFLKKMPSIKHGTVDWGKVDPDNVTVFALLPLLAPALDGGAVRVSDGRECGKVAVLRYLKDFVALAFIEDGAGVAAPAVTSLAVGAPVGHLVAALRAAEQLATPQYKGACAPCVVRVSPLGVSVLQLRGGGTGTPGGQDVFLPVGPPGMLPGDHYRGTELDEALSERLASLYAALPPGQPTDTSAFSN